MKGIAIFIGIAVAIFGAASARAGGPVIIDIPNFSVTAPASGTVSGFFDVLLMPNGINPATKLAAFDVVITIPTSQGIFLLATPYIQTPANYVFATSAGAPTAIGTSSAYSVIGEGDVSISKEQALNATYGLVRVPYTVGPVVSAETFTISMTPGASDATDGAGNDLNPTLVNGTVTINPSPEPGSLFTSGLVAVMALLIRRRDKRAASRIPND